MCSPPSGFLRAERLLLQRRSTRAKKDGACSGQAFQCVGCGGSLEGILQ